MWLLVVIFEPVDVFTGGVYECTTTYGGRLPLPDAGDSAVMAELSFKQLQI